MKKRKTVFFILIIGVLILLFCKKYDTVKIMYFKVFKKDGQIFHSNKEGKFEGQALVYSKGHLMSIGNFKNGLREGFVTQYFSNGIIKNKTFYKDDKIEGMEYEYYDNGKVNYKANWKNNKYYGSEWHWLNNGTLALYNSSDTKDLFYYSEYDVKGELKKTIGHIISPNVYTKLTTTDSLIVLEDKKQYHNFNDLYIPVATPPNLSTVIDVIINRKTINSPKILNNTIFLKDVFSNTGYFELEIRGKLIDLKNRAIKKDTLKLTVTKK